MNTALLKFIQAHTTFQQEKSYNSYWTSSQLDFYKICILILSNTVLLDFIRLQQPSDMKGSLPNHWKPKPSTRLIQSLKNTHHNAHRAPKSILNRQTAHISIPPFEAAFAKTTFWSHILHYNTVQHTKRCICEASFALRRITINPADES